MMWLGIGLVIYVLPYWVNLTNNKIVLLQMMLLEYNQVVIKVLLYINFMIDKLCHSIKLFPMLRK